jgi:hypothetical protein
MKKATVALVGMIAALVLLVLSFLGPWYIINASGILGAEYTVELYLTRVDLQGKIGGQDVMLSTGYTEAKMYLQDTNVNMESFAMIENALYLTLVAMVIAGITIICMTVFVYNKEGQKTMKFAGGLFGVLTFLLTILLALYAMNTEFVENISGFWFGVSILGMRITGGPGYGWYLMIVVAIIALISAATILLVKIPGNEALADTIASS